MKVLETHIVPAIKEKIRLQEYAPLVFKTISTKSGLKKAIKRNEILINGEIAKTSDWVEEHQKIELLQQENSAKKIFKLKLQVLFEDPFLAVINKPAGYPTSGNYFKTIENALPFNLQPSSEVDALPNPLPVHRLDNPTAGLLIIAKCRKAQLLLSRQFEAREIVKTYLALVHGTVENELLLLDELDAKPAKTVIRPLREIIINNENFSLVEALPETGRTHQLRRHLSMANFPIVGDDLYGIQKPTLFKGLYLASIKLGFTHPITQKPTNLSLPHPKKFQIF